MKPFIFSLFCFQLVFSSFAQTNDNKIRYVYSACTDEAKKELFELLKDDKVKLKECYNEYYSVCKGGKVVLSSAQYAPIAIEIKKYKSNNNVSYSEGEIFAKKADEKYILVTDLINKK